MVRGAGEGEGSGLAGGGGVGVPLGVFAGDRERAGSRAEVVRTRLGVRVERREWTGA